MTPTPTCSYAICPLLANLDSLEERILTTLREMGEENERLTGEMQDLIRISGKQAKTIAERNLVNDRLRAELADLRERSDTQMEMDAQTLHDRHELNKRLVAERRQAEATSERLRGELMATQENLTAAWEREAKVTAERDEIKRQLRVYDLAATYSPEVEMRLARITNDT